MSTAPKRSLSTGPFSTEPPETGSPGHCQGRRVSGPQGEYGVVVECLGPDIVGHARYRAAILNDQRLPVDEKVIVISSRWRWTFPDPDREKMPPEELGRLRDGLHEALARERDKRAGEIRAAWEALERLQSAYERRRPPKTQAVIVAERCETREGDSPRTVLLAWSSHTRNLFSELRKAAALFAPTADLADGPKGNEHREERRPGNGYHLSLCAFPGQGWKVRKLPADCPVAWKAELDPPERLPSAPARPQKADLPTRTIPLSPGDPP